MNNLIKILIGSLILVSIYMSGYYRGNYVRGLKDNVEALNLKIEQNQDRIMQLNIMNGRLQTQNIIDEKIVADNQSQLFDLQSKYAQAQKDNQYVKEKLNSSNRINLLWVQYVEGLLNPTGMSSLSSTSSGVDATSIYVSPSDTADEIGERFNVCQQDIIKYKKLEDWILMTASNYNESR